MCCTLMLSTLHLVVGCGLPMHRTCQTGMTRTAFLAALPSFPIYVLSDPVRSFPSLYCTFGGKAPLRVYRLIAESRLRI